MSNKQEQSREIWQRQELQLRNQLDTNGKIKVQTNQWKNQGLPKSMEESRFINTSWGIKVYQTQWRNQGSDTPVKESRFTYISGKSRFNSISWEIKVQRHQSKNQGSQISVEDQESRLPVGGSPSYQLKIKNQGYQLEVQLAISWKSRIKATSWRISWISVGGPRIRAIKWKFKTKDTIWKVKKRGC